MKWGKQHHYCLNCGKHQYDDRLSMTHVLSLMCSPECLHEWNTKYARKILGRDDVFNV